MPSFQQVRFIQTSLESVLSQSYPYWELLVQDGGSADGTLDVLREMSKRDPRIRWVSEPDNGPADALNKAFFRSRGSLIAWLNSDDVLMPDAFKSAVDHFNCNSSHLMVYGHGDHIDGQGRVLGRYPTVHIKDWVLTPSMTCQICQPTVMFKRSMAVMLGPFDTSLKTAFDFEYWLRALRYFPERIGFIDEVRAQSRLHDSTITATQRETVALEGLGVVHRHAGRVDAHWLRSLVDEQMRAFDVNGTNVGDVVKVRHTLESTFEAAGQWLPETQLQEIRQYLNARLQS